MNWIISISWANKCQGLDLCLINSSTTQWMNDSQSLSSWIYRNKCRSTSHLLYTIPLNHHIQETVGHDECTPKNINQDFDCVFMGILLFEHGMSTTQLKRLVWTQPMILDLGQVCSTQGFIIWPKRSWQHCLCYKDVALYRTRPLVHPSHYCLPWLAAALQGLRLRTENIQLEMPVLEPEAFCMPSLHSTCSNVFHTSMPLV